MRKHIRRFFLSTFLIVLCSGCFSSKPQALNVSSIYAFEGRYDTSKQTIIVEDKKIETKSGDSVWILSNHTLYNLLTNVSDNPNKIVFGSRTFEIDSSKKNIVEMKIIDSFDEEEYVWNNWIIK